MTGFRQRRQHRAVDALDRRIVEHDRGALRVVRQPGNAAAANRPVHLHRRRLAAFGNRRRRLEVRDQQVRLIDLRDHHDLAQARGERGRRARGLRHQRHAGVFATHFKTERIAGDRALAAIIFPAGFGFPRPPGVGTDADLGGRIEPERAPADGGDYEQSGQDEQAPKRATARCGGHVRHAASFGR